MTRLCLLLAVAMAVSCAAENSAPDEVIEDMAVSTPSVDASVSDDAATPPDSAVPDAGVCLPDLAPSVACGRCGAAMVSCVRGNVTTSACMGEHGTCAATDIQTTSDGCLIKHCAKDCSMWGFWELKPPAVCSFNTGETGSCNAGPSCPRPGTRKCIAGCKWGPCQCL